jgi:hypothetical protein
MRPRYSREVSAHARTAVTRVTSSFLTSGLPRRRDYPKQTAPGAAMSDRNELQGIWKEKGRSLSMYCSSILLRA